MPSGVGQRQRPTAATGGMLGSSNWIDSKDPDFEVDWESDDDQSNPRNWPIWYRGVLIGFVSFATLIVVLYSTSYTSGMPGLKQEYSIEADEVVTIGVTTYLVGLAVGSVLLAPLSEMFGRRPVYLVSMFIFMLLILPCALARSLKEILVVRFFGAVAGAAMIANSPGSVSDIVGDEYRALAFSVWSIGPLNGPVLGPIIGGFTYQYLGWRWTNWLVLIIAGVAFLMVAVIKETYTPTILRNKAAQKRSETNDDRWWSHYDTQASFSQLMRTNLARPFVMIFTEPICIFWDLYIGVIYGILYLCFVSYPIVFSSIRQWTPGIAGLSFVGIGIGSLSVTALEPFIRRMVNSHERDPVTGRVSPEATVSVICIAAILVPIGEIWFAWTSIPVTVHWAAPIAAGIPFGAGNTLIFIYSSNYLAGSYGIYAASALAGNAVIRSIMGGTLPLAGPAMYRSLGAHWAGTMLAGLEIILIPIPFVFYRYGGRIRKKSAMIRVLQEDHERNQRRRSSIQALKAIQSA
ncbi:MAG: hypothetical protein M1814_004987 [Vezdaea aestivalis]|nr:MAG: hypothetical protein M1814_004987 [Vezdaea aestivalis]